MINNCAFHTEKKYMYTNNKCDNKYATATVDTVYCLQCSSRQSSEGGVYGAQLVQSSEGDIEKGK